MLLLHVCVYHDISFLRMCMMALRAVTLSLLFTEYCCTINIVVFAGNLIIYSVIKQNVTSFVKKQINK